MAENTAFKTGESQHSRLQIELTTVSEDDLPVYIAGNFNKWRTADKTFRLSKTAPGKYRFQFPEGIPLPERLEYKYHRGTWGSEELDEHGKEIPNRVVPSNAQKIEDYVPLWKKAGLTYDPAYLPNIQIISESFEIPQLIKTRRIAALLPNDYNTTDRHYPVLYLQDGQNLFDDYAPFGNWAVDKKLAVLKKKGLGDVIIVAIDHAKEERIAEFTPSYHTKLGRGDGKKYVRFLADTLKPHIDNHFRTKPERQFTGLGGSSMGGLISIYGGLMYPEVYSKLMIMSPSLWVTPKIHFHAIDFDEAHSMKIYLYGGRKESVNMVPNIQRFKETIESQGIAAKIEFNLSIDPQGEHNETRWGEEFPKALEWLFFDPSPQS